MGELAKKLHKIGVGSIKSVDELKSGDIVKYRRRKTPYDPTYDKGGEPFREPWKIGRVRNIADKTPFFLQEGRCVTIDERVKKKKRGSSNDGSGSVTIREVSITKGTEQIKRVTPIGKFFLRRAQYSYHNRGK